MTTTKKLRLKKRMGPTNEACLLCDETGAGGTAEWRAIGGKNPKSPSTGEGRRGRWDPKGEESRMSSERLAVGGGASCRLVVVGLASSIPSAATAEILFLGQLLPFFTTASHHPLTCFGRDSNAGCQTEKTPAHRVSRSDNESQTLGDSSPPPSFFFPLSKSSLARNTDSRCPNHLRRHLPSNRPSPPPRF